MKPITYLTSTLSDEPSSSYKKVEDEDQWYLKKDKKD